MELFFFLKREEKDSVVEFVWSSFEISDAEKHGDNLGTVCGSSAPCLTFFGVKILLCKFLCYFIKGVFYPKGFSGLESFFITPRLLGIKFFITVYYFLEELLFFLSACLMFNTFHPAIAAYFG